MCLYWGYGLQGGNWSRTMPLSTAEFGKFFNTKPDSKYFRISGPYILPQPLNSANVVQN